MPGTGVSAVKYTSDDLREHTICPSFNTNLLLDYHDVMLLMEECLTPVKSACGLRSSQTYTEPGEIILRSSLSNRRVTIGRRFKCTAWKMIRASEGDRILRPVQVARCIEDGCHKVRCEKIEESEKELGRNQRAENAGLYLEDTDGEVIHLRHNAIGFVDE
jgi:hypothetical protein